MTNEGMRNVCRDMINLIERRFNHHLSQAPFCDKGVNAYDAAGKAFAAAVRDARMANDALFGRTS